MPGTAKPADSHEKSALHPKEREHVRSRVFKGASILFNEGRSSFDCVVRNLSEGGARVALETTVGVPSEFVLLIADGRSHRCTVRWRSLKELGVAFQR